MTSTVSHNVINGNTGVGGSIFANAGGVVTFENNVISGNAQDGIFVSQLPFTSGIRVTNNTSLANGGSLGGFDLFSQSPGCTGTVWSGNKFFTANQSCIH